MTRNKARTELKRIRTYYYRISERKKRLSELRSAMSTIKLSKCGNHPTAGATPRDQYLLKNAIARAIKLETRISNDILAMAGESKRLLANIASLPEPYATVLTKRYVDLKSFDEIGESLFYSGDSVKRLCATGLDKYAEKFCDNM